MTPTLTLDDDGVATIRLNRPQHLNRLHREDLQVLRQQFAVLAVEPRARVLVLTGQGRVFCAGFHIGELDGADDPRLFETTVEALEALALPSIARLNGSLYGGATDLALACDFRVGVRGMELRMPAARLGLHYYASGLQRYITRLGLPAAKRLFLLAEAVPAEALQALGYLDELVDADALDAAVARLVHALAANAPLAVRGMKQSLNELARGAADPARLDERIERCAASEDLREGRAAFAQRRAPVFRGR
ncbi:MAG: 3-hydroxybutyryl-CoA dehydratase [Rubrivivax sp. SCN 70-15]|nr:MAG: 3-hydroxybutyryl-CoA dehydratase [Rubrivivax sp. SCN 70-15]